MYLTVVCPNCQTTYTVGQLDSLPQPSLLTSTLADLYHGHRCVKVLPPQIPTSRFLIA